MPDLFEAQQDRDQRFREEAEQPAQPAAIPSPVEPMIASDTTIPVAPSFTRMQRIKNKFHRMSLFTTYCENPENIHFSTQEPDEKVLIFMRKSKFLNLSWILTAVILAIMPNILFIFRDQFAAITPPPQYLLLIIPFYYLLIITYAFVNFIIWYYNAALVTNKRVIDIDFHQLVMKEVDETKLALVQDISYRQEGVFENMFDFGYVLIQTAGTIDNFEFYGLPKPDHVVQVVQQLIGGRRAYEP